MLRFLSWFIDDYRIGDTANNTQQASVPKFVILQGYTDVLCCTACGNHITRKSDTISTNFHGRGGRALLVSSVVNVRVGEAQERLLMTGRHVVSDISCCQCGQLLGWFYDRAFEESQKYKEGKFVVESKWLVADS